MDPIGIDGLSTHVIVVVMIIIIIVVVPITVLNDILIVNVIMPPYFTSDWRLFKSIVISHN